MTVTKHLFLIAISGVIAIGSMQRSESCLAGDRKLPAVSVKQFGPSNVIGHLGKPLGTVVRITGVCLDGSKTRRRADLGKTLLEIQTVNGTKLQRPFIVPFLRAAKGIAKPKDGDAFDYYAHEWGEFDGVVTIAKELEIERPMVANDGFHYRPQITIHKSNSVVGTLPLQQSRTKR